MGNYDSNEEDMIALATTAAATVVASHYYENHISKEPCRNLKLTGKEYIAELVDSNPVRIMVANGAAPARGSAAAAAGLRRRRTTSGGGAPAGAGGNMLQFYTDDAPGLKISPNVVLVMSIGFIAFVAVLHVVGKLYLVRRE
ncbi:hypothetical protein GIB67_027547 [Kingdonia uniflora]|uniref:Protein transport protein Sec61 subunit beta n=1 Tax=Kingdonia uniflora TaxID=39325 RepID=A0A7J7NKL0_9MAGN|nr:hypothetical protein GIB67_027547 [Kingdonia uniflora]